MPACICEFFLYHLWIVVQHHVSLHSQVRPVFSPYSITESFSCTSSLLELRFSRTGLLFQDINSHWTMFLGFDCLKVLTLTGNVSRLFTVSRSWHSPDNISRSWQTPDFFVKEFQYELRGLQFWQVPLLVHSSFRKVAALVRFVGELYIHELVKDF